MEWFSYAVAVILLLSSIVSPIIVTIINNNHQSKLKKIDIYENNKRKALSEFIECSQDYLLNRSYIEQNIKYYSAINKLFIYFKDINLTTFMKFDGLAQDENDYRKAILELSNIVQDLSKQIQKE